MWLNISFSDKITYLYPSIRSTISVPICINFLLSYSGAQNSERGLWNNGDGTGYVRYWGQEYMGFTNVAHLKTFNDTLKKSFTVKYDEVKHHQVSVYVG